MEKNNFFEEIRRKRENFKEYAEQALQYQWINKQEYEDILHKIENDKLTIGVIGQMKCGKSTFLNALIFKDEVLPAATTPMTASLSVITYGETKKLQAEFYTSQEWKELKMQADRSLDEVKGNSDLEAKVKAAKEIVGKSVGIRSEIEKLLGTKRDDKFENLIEYVGADGKYIAITKSVRISYPLDYLKGVEIVDTPGFNDPVVSREERTKDFLSKADVVIMLLYAGRAFDATDKDIIFNKVRKIGVGKLLVGVNKYDINYANGETHQQMIDYVKQQLTKANEDYENNSIHELIKEQDPLLLSANMALMAQMDLQKIQKNKDWQFYYKKALDDFEITSQKELYEKSLMPSFEEAIKNIVFNSKDTILIRKPINLIKQIGENKSNDISNECNTLANTIKILEIPDEEKEEKLSGVEKAKKRIIRKINSLNIDLEEILEKHIRKAERELENDIENSEKKSYQIVENKRVVDSESKLFHNLEREEELLNRKIKRTVENLNSGLNNELKKALNSFILDTRELMEKFLEDFDYGDRLGIFRKMFIKKDIISFSPKKEQAATDNDPSFLEVVGVIGIATLLAPVGLGMGIIDMFDKSEYRQAVKKQYASFDLQPIRKTVEEKGEELSVEIHEALLEDFINPLESELKKALEEKDKQQENLVKSKEKYTLVQANKQEIEKQVEQMKALEKII